MVKDKAQLNSVCENFINHVKDFYDIPGLAIGVCCGDLATDTDCREPFEFIGNLGYRNYVAKDPVLEDTVFHCTSVSKLFTAAGIMVLVDSGKLTLDDKLCEVLSWMSIADKRWRNITIENMLCHTSGLTDVSDYNWECHEIDENSFRRYALSDEVAERKLLWDPTEGKFRYSSLAYNLLGAVIAEVSGKPFEEFIDEEIFKPLSMNNSTFKTFERVSPNVNLSDETMIGKTLMSSLDDAGLAMPHSKGKDRVITLEKEFPYTREHAPSSTLTSTTGDLLKWAKACMDDNADTPQGAPLHGIMKTMWQEKAVVADTGEKMGLGWFIRGLAGNDGKTYTLMGHEGSDDGFRTSFWVCPEEKVGIALLCNLTDAPLKKLSNKLFKDIVAI